MFLWHSAVVKNISYSETYAKIVNRKLVIGSFQMDIREMVKFNSKEKIGKSRSHLIPGETSLKT